MRSRCSPMKVNGRSIRAEGEGEMTDDQDFWSSEIIFLEHVDGETFSVNLAIPVGPIAIHLIALKLSTVINGPPERSRTRSPLLNGGAAPSCIAVCDGAESENAGIDKGILSATPSVNAIAIETRFVNAIMLSSTLAELT